MSKLSFSENWKYSVRMNGDALNWRECIADKLRSLAGIIDGRRSVAISMLSTPRITKAKKSDCLVAGFQHCERLFRNEVKTEAVEIGFKKILPELFESE